MDPAVVDHDPSWAAAFEAERRLLTGLLGEVLTTDVEHVGSTSVRALRAKPIIDMLAGVRSLAAADGVHGPLAAHGYRHAPHRPEARLFVRVDAVTGFDTHHLHLTVPGSDLWTERLTFRDALRDDPELVRRYTAWKRTHATGDPAGAYDAGKTEFVGAVLAAHGVRLKSNRDRLDPDA